MRTRIASNGYVIELAPSHPRAGQDGMVLQHVLVAERALGKHIGREHPIHHIDGDCTNNAAANLVVCESNAYHKLLHRRERALRACGEPSWVRCLRCKSYGPASEMVVHERPNGAGIHAYHRECKRAYERHLSARRRAVA